MRTMGKDKFLQRRRSCQPHLSQMTSQISAVLSLCCSHAPPASITIERYRQLWWQKASLWTYDGFKKIGRCKKYSFSRRSTAVRREVGTTVTMCPCMLIILCAPFTFTDLIAEWRRGTVRRSLWKWGCSSKLGIGHKEAFWFLHVKK